MKSTTDKSQRRPSRRSLMDALAEIHRIGFGARTKSVAAEVGREPHKKGYVRYRLVAEVVHE